MSSADYHDNICLKKLSSVSPDLPQLVEGLGSRPLKDHEILLLNGPELPDTCPRDLTHSHSQRAADVCVVQSSNGCHPVKSDSLVLQINKFLIGLQSGQERQRHVRLANQRVCEDDTNRSVSSIEEDFLTASEHLGEESEEDKNDADVGVFLELTGKAEKTKQHVLEREDSEDSDTLCASCKSHKVSRTSNRRDHITPKNSNRINKESNYASSLAESVLQDAFIHLTQDESSFTTEAPVSITNTPQKSTDEPTRTRTHSFELPKIVIVQSPDNCDEHSEWPGAQSFSAPEPQDTPMTETQPCLHHSSSIMNVAKPVEIALACAASIIGTISNPQVTKQIVLELENDEIEMDEEEEPRKTQQRDVSLPPVVCAIDQLAEAEDTGCVTKDLSATSIGLLSAAQASTAAMLHCNVAEGSSVDLFRYTVSELLLKEALEVLVHKQSYTSMANFLETTHNKIVDGTTHPEMFYQNHPSVDDFTQDVAESMIEYALEKSAKRKELSGTDDPNAYCFLLESLNNLIFGVLCATSKKIGDILQCTPELSTRDKREISAKEMVATINPGAKAKSQLQILTKLKQPEFNETANEVEKASSLAEKKEKVHQAMHAEKESTMCMSESTKHTQIRTTASKIKEAEIRQPGFSSSIGTLAVAKMIQSESRTPVACFAEDLATTVVSMATELAAICLENSSSKQPWFCALKGGSEGSEGLLLPCRTVSPFRKKETQNGVVIAKKHRAPRLSEIKRKTEEQPELMERLVNRVVDETVNVDDPAMSDPFALFASEVTARIMNCPELNVVDTSKPGQSSRSRLQCERWSSRGKASSYESIPEEESDSSGGLNTLDPGNRLGHNLSRGSSISKQSSCESITDEFSRFMVNQMETEGRGFDLLLDYYAGKNASSILAAAIQQVTGKKNGHLNVRSSACLSKQSSTESITEEFYRYMLKDMDKENKDYGISKTKDWSNSLLPPPSRSPFCIRQSSVPDRRSSDSRLTVNSPIKANSFDGFPRNVHLDPLSIYPSNSVSSTGLCKSDSCLYQRGQTDHITDMLIHETWASSIESLMRKNKIIAEPSEDSTEQDSSESQPHVQHFANRLATNIVESGKSFIGGQQELTTSQPSVADRRQVFIQSCSGITQSWSQPGRTNRRLREVPLIHIEPDQKDRGAEDMECSSCLIRDSNVRVQAQSSGEEVVSIQNRGSRTPTAPPSCVGECRSLSTSSEDSGSGGWAQVVPDEDPQEETTCSFINLSEGNGNSSASSLGVADLEGFPESASSALLNSAERLRVLQSHDQADELTSGLSTAGSSCHRELQVMNFDLEVESVDREMRAALQWIAASELGIPALYYQKTPQHTHPKFQKVVHLSTQRSWCVGDLFSLVVQFCRLQSQGEEELGLFDWLLKTQR